MSGKEPKMKIPNTFQRGAFCFALVAAAIHCQAQTTIAVPYHPPEAQNQTPSPGKLAVAAKKADAVAKKADAAKTKADAMKTKADAVRVAAEAAAKAEPTDAKLAAATATAETNATEADVAAKEATLRQMPTRQELKLMTQQLMPA
jgi:hypothetical protein